MLISFRQLSRIKGFIDDEVFNVQKAMALCHGLVSKAEFPPFKHGYNNVPHTRCKPAVSPKPQNRNDCFYRILLTVIAYQSVPFDT